MSSWIGEKRLKSYTGSGEKTPGGVDIVKAFYEDGTEEHFSEIMFNKIVTEKKCSLSELRDKRCQPVVDVLLAVLREWGIRSSELSYVSALLNNSLDYNKNQALNKLWSQWEPEPLMPDEVSLITVDRVLRHYGKGSKTQSRNETKDE